MGSAGGLVAQATGRGTDFQPNIPALVVLKAQLSKGMRWKDGPTTRMRACEVLGFVALKVHAGEYTNVAKLRVKNTYISSDTGKEEHAPTTNEYYAPKVGLVKVELVRQDGSIKTFIELTKFTPGH